VRCIGQQTANKQKQPPVCTLHFHSTSPRKKKREGLAVLYGTGLLLEPHGLATIQIFYDANHKKQKMAPVRKRNAPTPVRECIRFFFLTSTSTMLATADSKLQQQQRTRHRHTKKNTNIPRCFFCVKVEVGTKSN
jgi:hypothetical protein